MKKYKLLTRLCLLDPKNNFSLLKLPMKMKEYIAFWNYPLSILFNIFGFPLLILYVCYLTGIFKFYLAEHALDVYLILYFSYYETEYAVEAIVGRNLKGKKELEEKKKK